MFVVVFPPNLYNQEVMLEFIWIFNLPFLENFLSIIRYTAPVEWVVGPAHMVTDFQRGFSQLFSDRKGNCFLTLSRVCVPACLYNKQK